MATETPATPDRVAFTRNAWLATGKINDLVAYVDQWAYAKGWRARTDTSVGDRLMLMVTEIAEAMEEHRRHRRPDESYCAEDSLKPEGIPSELADTVIRIADFAALYGIDLDAAIRVKMAYNEGRPYRHGDKAL